MRQTARATIARLFAKLRRYPSFLNLSDPRTVADDDLAVVAGSQLFLARRTVRQSAHHSGQADSVNMSPANVITVSGAPRSRRSVHGQRDSPLVGRRRLTIPSFS